MDPAVLPPSVADLVADAEVVPVTVGMSDASTVRVVRPDGDWFVKVRRTDTAHPDLETTLADEAERLRWLADHLSVPEVIDTGADADHEWLVVAALPGSDATSLEHQFDPERLLQILGRALRRFHDTVPVDGCPFDSTTDTDLARAAARVDAGLVDESDFEALFAGMSASRLYELMVESRPGGDDALVVIHGDYCVPNVIVDAGSVSGYVDLGRSGVGDRHRDLGIAARSVAQNFGGHAVPVFVDAYGLEQPDLARLDFFIMLDEFF